MQTPLCFKLSEAGKSSPKLTSFGGLPLIVEMYRRMSLDKVISRHVRLKERGWRESDIVESLVALQVAGGSRMDDVQWLDADASTSLYGDDSGLPSPAAVRRFLHLFDAGVSEPRSLGMAIVPEENNALRGLGKVHRAVIDFLVAHTRPQRITLDVDATVVKSDKSSCLPTYKGDKGYQPMQGIWAEHQVVVAEEFRDGNVPAAFGALAFLKKCEAALPDGVPLRLRSDAAWYQHDVFDYCQKQGHEFAIGADLSQGLMRFVQAIPKWNPLHVITSKGKIQTKQEWAELSFTTASLSKADIKRRIRDYRYIIIREYREQTDLFAGQYEYRGFISNMGWDAERLIQWARERAGTIEQVIDRLKHDFAGDTFPCGTFGANAAWWRITCLVHNLVQCLKLVALPLSWFYMRMKTLRFRLFGVAGRIITHARCTWLQLARGHPIIPIYREARLKLAAL